VATPLGNQLKIPLKWTCMYKMASLLQY